MAATGRSFREPYAAAILLAALLALIGFWPTYFGRFVNGAVDTTLLIHAHAVVQVVWFALFATQVALVATGRVALHAKLVLVPAIGRMTFLGTPPSLGDFMLVWPLPVYVAMIHTTSRSG